jgi:hypothetical protein
MGNHTLKSHVATLSKELDHPLLFGFLKWLLALCACQKLYLPAMKFTCAIGLSLLDMFSSDRWKYWASQPCADEF